MTAAAPAHSSVVGGSNAQRVLACPASVKTIRAVPPELVKESSIYADEGTALHSCVAMMLPEGRHPYDFVGAVIRLDNGVDITITKRLPIAWRRSARSSTPRSPMSTNSGSRSAASSRRVRYVRFRRPRAGAARLRRLEIRSRRRRRRDLSGPGRSGARDHQRSAALLHLRPLPDLFTAGLPIDAYIVQPRNQNPDQRVTVARGISGSELDAFEVALRAGVDAAFKLDPPRHRGAHCRFAPCRAICPAHTGPLLDLARMQKLQRPNNVAIAFGKLSAYGETLAAGLELAEIVEPLIRELRSQAHAFLSDHHPVSGWKLVAKRAVRRWADGEAARKTLLKSGFAAADIFEEPALRSPAQIEKAAKLAGLPLPDLEIIAASSGSTLARATDDRPPVPDRDAAIDSFVRAIATLKEHTDG